MAWIQARFFSEMLNEAATIDVLLPYADAGIGVSESIWDGKTPLPVLYLLHGWSDDSSTWLRRTSLERYAANKRLAIVIPTLRRSLMADLPDEGYKYLSFLQYELPKVAGDFFKLSDKREETFLAGLSMGGYGAFKLALLQPEKYAAAASMSGALGFSYTAEYFTNGKLNEKSEQLKRENPYIYKSLRDFVTHYGSFDSFAGSDDALGNLLEQNVKAEKALPSFYISVGREDFLYNDNRLFVERMADLAVPYEYKEFDGIHEWAVWDREIQTVLNWLMPSEK
jgi:S-formylglutathione hydrolase FrmB